MVKKEKINQLLTLSKPEIEVLKFFCTGTTNKKISKELFIAEGTVRSHMRNIYIKLALFGYPTTKRRFIIIKEYCHLLRDPEYLKALEEDIKIIDQEGKALIVIEPDEERDRDVDDVIEEDSKYWLMVIPIEKAEPLPPIDIVPVDDVPKPKPNPFQIGLFVFALIGFAAVAIFGFELITGRLNIFRSEAVSQSQPSIQEDELSPPEAEQAEQSEVILPTAIPTSDEIIPTESPTYTPPPKPAVLFEDDFEAGLSESWEVVTGNPIIANGMLTSDQITWLLIGSPDWKKYSVEIYARSPIIFAWDDKTTIGLHVQDIGNMYAMGFFEGTSELYKVKNGEWNAIPSTEVNESVNSDMKNYKFSIDEGVIDFQINGIRISSFFDDEFESGRVAIRIRPDVVIDYIKIREILD